MQRASSQVFSKQHFFYRADDGMVNFCINMRIVWRWQIIRLLNQFGAELSRAELLGGCLNNNFEGNYVGSSEERSSWKSFKLAKY